MDLGQVLALGMALGFVLGWVTGWIQGSEPLKVKVKVLQSRLQSLETEMKWEKAKLSASQMDLERAREKLMWKD